MKMRIRGYLDGNSRAVCNIERGERPASSPPDVPCCGIRRPDRRLHHRGSSGEPAENGMAHEASCCRHRGVQGDRRRRVLASRPHRRTAAPRAAIHGRPLHSPEMPWRSERL